MELLVDVHAHMDYKDFSSDRDEVLKRAKDSGVKFVINNGLDHKTNIKTLELAKKYDIILPAMGIYPNSGLEMTEDEINSEIEFIKSHKADIVAVGEIGIDRKYVKDKDTEQSELFKKMVELAKELDKPIIVHTRAAEEMVIDILEEIGIKKVILHCFTGNLELAKRAEKLGYFFSIPPRIVHSKTFQDLVKEISITQLLTETDSPFLGPIPDKRNEPSFVVQTIKKIAEIKELDEKETANNIFMNYQKIF